MTGCIDHGQHGRQDMHGSKWAGPKLGVVGYHVYVFCKAVGVCPTSLRGTGKVVRHKCDNRRCINPEHLELGDHADNMRDMCERKRSCRGTNQKDAKLTYELAEEIRASTGKSQRQLAKEYGVSQYQIWSVLNNKTWVR